MTKTIAEALADLHRKTNTTWAATLATDPNPHSRGPSDTGSTTDAPNGDPDNSQDAGPAAWPLRLPLGRPSSHTLTHDWPTVQTWAITWRDWATRHHLPLTWTTRSIDGIRQALPTHLTVPDLDTAATLLGGDWPTRLTRARHRLATLRTHFPHAATPATLTAVDRLTDLDYRLLLDAADWFSHHDATGLTPRQVPLEGVHGKWLNAHHRLLETLTGKPTLGLVDRPARIHYTYLDPTHLAHGGRRHDSHTLGDTTGPAYQPTTVLITENKDTALFFPPLPDAIAIDGNGHTGPTLIAALDWVHAANHVYYWGDIDAAGYEIVHRYRAAGLPVTTLLMDPAAYDTYETYGAWTDAKGTPLPCPPRKTLTHLTTAEATVYTRLTDPTWQRVRRIEQERIPLAVAHHHLDEDRRATTTSQTPLR